MMKVSWFKDQLVHLFPYIKDDDAFIIAKAVRDMRAEDVENLKNIREENESLKREREAQYTKLVELQTQLKANTLEKRLNELEVIIKDAGGVSEKIEKLQEKIGRLDV